MAACRFAQYIFLEIIFLIIHIKSIEMKFRMCILIMMTMMIMTIMTIMTLLSEQRESLTKSCIFENLTVMYFNLLNNTFNADQLNIMISHGQIFYAAFLVEIFSSTTLYACTSPLRWERANIQYTVHTHTHTHVRIPSFLTRPALMFVDIKKYNKSAKSNSIETPSKTATAPLHSVYSNTCHVQTNLALILLKCLPKEQTKNVKKFQ